MTAKWHINCFYNGFYFYVSNIFCYSILDIQFACMHEWFFIVAKKKLFIKKFNNTFLGFPFYTLGRFVNTPCLGSNQLMGTCVLAGECSDAGGVATGSCNSITRQAICCVCKFLSFSIYQIIVLDNFEKTKSKNFRSADVRR